MIATILLQAGGTGYFESIKNFAPMILIVVVFYFFMIRPQIKKQKEQKNYVNELKKGDKIITTSGMHGKIIDVAETTFLIETEGGHKIRYEKSSVSLEASKPLNTTPAVKS